MIHRTRILCWLPLLFLVSLACATLGPAARADVWNQSTRLTFSDPVEIPGKVLPAGTYVFQLMDNPANRDVVEIYNRDRTRLYAVVMAIPVYRLNPKSHTVVTFEERPSALPMAVHKWFYPDTQYGHEFVYSRQAEMEATRIYRRLKSRRG